MAEVLLERSVTLDGISSSSAVHQTEQTMEIVTVNSAGAISMEDFRRLHLTPSPKAGNITQCPSTEMQAVRAYSLEPVPLRRASPSDAIKNLHEICQERAIPFPTYEYRESRPQQFSVKMTVAGHVFEESGPFASKKGAKQAISEAGLDKVKTLGTTSIRQERMKPEENFIGILYEYSAATSMTAPIFEEFALGSGFSCEVALSTHPENRFGSRTIQFPNKKTARVNAAREAVQRLRQTGHLPAAGSPKPKAKSMKRDSLPSSPKHELSFAVQLNTLCSELSIPSPQYRFESPAQGFFTGGAYFEGLPTVPSLVGEVRNIYGKNKAKEECARGVIEYLQIWRDERTQEME